WPAPAPGPRPSALPHPLPTGCTRQHPGPGVRLWSSQLLNALVPDLGVACRTAARPAVAGPFPPEVETDAERENGEQGDDRGGLVDEGGEHERHQDHRGRPDRE